MIKPQAPGAESREEGFSLSRDKPGGTLDPIFSAMEALSVQLTPAAGKSK